ncbi:hypothetical protein SAY87_031898 [Trapa incisa]|uniref:RING-type E3 ubiquitin transferase n=1 Tax=Trapa incisa TaxID=236973 RepID=A0AAN7KY24_9MYRT|nr:hypothetical protein SAY87_031898 [Trapa incisa]
MWLPKGHRGKKVSSNGLVAVAINKAKGRRSSSGCAVDDHHHHHHSDANGGSASPNRQHHEKITRELFLSFHCFCTRKDINCYDVILEGADVVKTLTEYISSSGIENLVLGATSRHGFIRFKTSSLSSSVSKAAPDFCNVYTISKGKISTMRRASRQAPYTSPLLEQIHNLNKEHTESAEMKSIHSVREDTPMKAEHDYPFRPPFGRGRHQYLGDTTDSKNDISFVSSGRPSSDRSPSFLYDAMDDVSIRSRLSASSEGFESAHSGSIFGDHGSLHDILRRDCSASIDSHSTHHLEEVETEMRRLKQEVQQTMNMYNTACKEALTAKEKARELHRWRLDEEQKLEEARLAQEAALSIARGTENQVQGCD